MVSESARRLQEEIDRERDDLIQILGLLAATAMVIGITVYYLVA